MTWKTLVKLDTSFKVAVDCVGPEGVLTIHAANALSLVRQCRAGYTTYAIDDYPSKAPKEYELAVRAPRGAKWALLIIQLP